MKVSEETVKIELHTIATYDGKEYELEELMNSMFKRNAELHSIIKEVRKYVENNSYFESNIVKTMVLKDYSNGILEILDKVGDEK